MSPQEIEDRLQGAFTDGVVEVTDLTGTQDHYSVYVKSIQFKGLSRIQRQQAVMAVFAAELKTGEVHALTIKTEIPD